MPGKSFSITVPTSIAVPKVIRVIRPARSHRPAVPAASASLIRRSWRAAKAKNVVAAPKIRTKWGGLQTPTSRPNARCQTSSNGADES